MALMLAYRLKKEGYFPIVYGLSEAVCKKHMLERVIDLDQVPENIFACVIGGGAFLQNESGPFVRMLEKFISWVNTSNIPVLAISIGGDGDYSFIRGGESDTCNDRVLSLLRTCDSWVGITVRLEGEVTKFDEFTGLDCRYYPDIVLCANTFLSEKQPKKSRHIVVSANNNLKNKLFFWFASVFVALQKYHVKYLATHLPDSPYYKKDLSGWSGAQCAYLDPFEFLRVISDSNVLVSNKLHVGVSAISCGVPFVSYAGKPKTKAFMKEAGLSDFCVPKKEPAKLISILSRVDDNVIIPYNDIHFSRIQDLSEKAEGHFTFLLEKLQKLD